MHNVDMANNQRYPSNFMQAHDLVGGKYNTFQEPQRKLNPTIKEVVKKEISKLHDVRIIHPTINGQVLYTFLKQIGMIVVRN